MIDPPEVSVYDPDASGFLRFTDPDATLVQTEVAEPPVVSGRNLQLPEDPFRSLNTFCDAFDSGILAGWISYDFARLNPLYTFEATSGDESPGPVFALAHYPGERADYERNQLPAGDVSLGPFSPEEDRGTYTQSIRNIRTLIEHGYVYQINYSQRFGSTIHGNLLELLGSIEPSDLPPHTAHGRMGEYEFLSLSPERFLQLDGRGIRTEPIKGTRPRSEDPTTDRSRMDELRESEKDRAEHTMIVDLERNDLGQLCEPGSVRVPSLRRLETFPTVHHLVSTVEGRLRPGVGFGDLLRKLFPGGSITGCPKRIAMRIIDRLEGRSRGLYTGTVGHWDLNENVADWNIAIRTLRRFGNRAWWDAGGGIVIDSTPDKEYAESLDKVELIKMIRRRTDTATESAHRETTVQ